MPRVRASLLAQEAKKSLREYLRNRLWHWATKENFALSLDYAIHLLNSKPNDPFALYIGEEIAKYSGQTELEQKCRKASSSLAFIKGVSDVSSLLPGEGPSAISIQEWKENLRKKFGSSLSSSAHSTEERPQVPSEESLLVKSSASLEAIQRHCREASLRASTTPQVEVLHPAESQYGRGLYALHRIAAGSTILIDEPIMAFAGSSHACAHCLAPIETSSAVNEDTRGSGSRICAVGCPHCGLERYCSTSCCKAAWETYHCCSCRSRNPSYSEWHEKVKESLLSDRDRWADPNSSYRVSLACLAVGKICAMATVKQCHPLKMDKIRFLRGVAHYDRDTALHQIGSLAVLLSSALHQPYLFLEDVLSIFAILQTNEFLVEGSITLYPLLSLLNHSCVPNCIAVGTSGNPTKRQLIALSNIREGEQLFIDYNSSLSSRLAYEDRKALCAQRQFTCFCMKCLRKE